MQADRRLAAHAHVWRSKLAAVVVAALLPVLVPTSAPVTEAGADVGRSCFGDQIKHSKAARIARNTVFIAGMKPDGTLTSSASGFVAQGPHGARIITAAHAIDAESSEDRSTFMVFFSDGTPIGVPRVVAATAPRRLTVADTELTVDDLAVLQIARFNDPAARRRFSALDGLQLAKTGQLLVGETDGATAVAWGYSGAPAVDVEGNAVGVLTSADFRGRVTVGLATIQEATTNGRRVDARVILPVRSFVVVEPLHDPTIMNEVTLAGAPDERVGTTKVVFAGFPSASCASTTAGLVAAASPAGAGLLRKWERMDQSGAWWIQPGFSIKGVNLLYR